MRWHTRDGDAKVHAVPNSHGDAELDGVGHKGELVAKERSEHDGCAKVDRQERHQACERGAARCRAAEERNETESMVRGDAWKHLANQTLNA